ncbi:MAG: carboxypeptidase regulatory-like domain-containing protein [Actinobacteria bacterium]|nr:carboxypeptidase regulatory-like domain-containing protein [Actinomycetota bacterium]
MPPTLQLVPPDPDRLLNPPTNPPPSAFNFGGWNSGVRSVWLEAADSASGVFYVEGELSGPFDGTRFDCGDPFDTYPSAVTVFLGFCLAWDFNYFTVNTRDQQMGKSTMRLRLHDAAGNVTTVERPVWIDNIPPLQPVGVRVMPDGFTSWRNESLIGMEWTNPGETVETSTQSGIVRAVYDVSPTAPGQTDPGPVSVSGAAISAIPAIPLPGDGEWRVQLWVQDGASFSSGKFETIVRVDRVVPNAPVLEPLGIVSGVGGDAQFGWLRPANVADLRSGICGYALSADRFEHADPGSSIRVYGDVTKAFLPNLPDGRSYLHMRAVSCSGVAGASVDLPVDVDRTPPKAFLLGSAPDAWLDENTPLLLGAADDGSGVADISFSVDGGPWRSANGDVASVSLGGGDHVVAYRARDVAGNESAVMRAEVRVDAAGPTGFFELVDPGRPTLVAATVADPESGVARAWFEYRAIGADGPGAWHSFGAQATPVPAEGKSVKLEAGFPDAALPIGVYGLRLIALDRLGHVLIAETRIDGSPASLTTPLRGTPGLAAGFPVSSRAKSACTPPRRARHTKLCLRRTGDVSNLAARRFASLGSSSRLAGRLTDAGGDPVSGAQIDLSSIAGDGLRRRLGQVETDGDGVFGFLVPPGPSRRIVTRFSGSATLSAREVVVRLATIGKATLHAPRFANGGSATVFTGRLLTGDDSVVTLGKSVDLEYKAGRAWFPLCNGSARDGGRFTIRCTLPKVKLALLLKLRAKVAGAPGWPFETGYSVTRELVIRPGRPGR